MSGLLTTLKNLKDKIFSMEFIVSDSNSNEPQRQFTNNSRETSNTKDLDERLEKKLENLVKDQSNRVKINAGGKIFEISYDIIMNTTYSNIFEQKIIKKSNDKLNKFNDSELFFDCNAKLFKYIYKLFSIFQNSNKSKFNENNKFKLIVSEDVHLEVLNAYIRQVFPNHNKLFMAIEIKGGKEEQGGSTTQTNVTAQTTVPPRNNYDDYDYDGEGTANQNIFDY